MDTITITDSIDSFLRQAGVHSARTIRTYRTGLGHFLAFLDTHEITPTAPTTTLTPNLARDFAAWLAHDYRDRQGRPLSETSRALYLIALGCFYHHLMVSKWLGPEVTMSDYEELRKSLVKMARRQTGLLDRRLPAPDVVDLLIEAARRPLPTLDRLSENRRKRLTLTWRRNLAMVLLLQSSGMRVGELVALRRGDLDYSGQGAYVTGKGKKQRFVLFSPEAWTALMAYLKERQDGETATALAAQPVVCRHDKRAGQARLPLSTNAVREVFEELALQAGILERFNMTPHKLRHYFATMLLRETGNLALTQDALGHANPETTRVYAKTTKADLQAAHRKIFGRRLVRQAHIQELSEDFDDKEA